MRLNRKHICASRNTHNIVASEQQPTYDTVLDRFLDMCDMGMLDSSELGIAISKWLSNDDFYEFVRANYYDDIFYDEY